MIENEEIRALENASFNKSVRLNEELGKVEVSFAVDEQGHRYLSNLTLFNDRKFAVYSCHLGENMDTEELDLKKGQCVIGYRVSVKDEKFRNIQFKIGGMVDEDSEMFAEEPVAPA